MALALPSQKKIDKFFGEVADKNEWEEGRVQITEPLLPEGGGAPNLQQVRAKNVGALKDGAQKGRSEEREEHISHLHFPTPAQPPPPYTTL